MVTAAVFSAAVALAVFLLGVLVALVAAVVVTAALLAALVIMAGLLMVVAAVGAVVLAVPIVGFVLGTVTLVAVVLSTALRRPRLRPALRRGARRVVGALTLREWRRARRVRASARRQPAVAATTSHEPEGTATASQPALELERV